MLDVKSQDIFLPEAVCGAFAARMKLPPGSGRQSAGGKTGLRHPLLPGDITLYYWEGKLEQGMAQNDLLKPPFHISGIDCLVAIAAIKRLNWFYLLLTEILITSWLQRIFTLILLLLTQHIRLRRIIRRAGSLAVRPLPTGRLF